MKILYVGRERSDAEAVATALRGIAENVMVSWTSRLDHAARWIDQNTDLAAVVVEAQIDGTSWRPLLERVRSLASHPFVVVILPEGTGPRFESLELEADEYLTKTQSLFRDLPIVVRRAVDRARVDQQSRQVLTSVGESHQRLEVTSKRLAQSDVHPAAVGAETSLQQHEQLWSVERAAAAECQAHLQELVDHERAARADLEQRLAHARATLQEAEERHQSAMAAAAEQMAKHQAQYEIGMARAAATWEMVDEQLRETAIALERGRRDQASAAANVERLSRREAELSSLLAGATATRVGLERRLADAETALEAANARAAHERRASAEQLAERQRDLQAQIAQEADERRVIEETLAHAVRDRDDAEKRHVERLTQREAELTSMLADATTSHRNLQRRLAATEAAFEDAGARATRERLAAAKRAAEREAQLDGQIQQERTTRATLEQAVADADGALHDAQQRHDAALTASVEQLADRQAQFDRELTQTAAARDSLTQRLIDAEVALDQVRHDHQSAAADVERLTQREADLTCQLAGVQASRDTLELRLADAVNAIADADERSAQERAAAADRHADLEAKLAEALDTRDTLEQTLAETRSAARDAERSLNEETNTLRMHALEQAAHFDGQLANERLEHKARLAEVQDCSRHLTLERDALQQSLDTTTEQLRRLDSEYREASARFEQDRAAADADIRQLAAERVETERKLEDSGRGFQNALDRLSSEHATALAALAAAVAERDAQLQEHAAHYASSQQAAEAARTELRENLQNALAARDHEIGQLQGKFRAANQALEATKRRQEVLQAEADKVSQLHTQLDESRAEVHRLFQQAPLAMFRCTRDGALTQANRAWTTLVRRKIDELRGADFAAAVFESPNDLSWLIEHCLSSRAKESIETTVRRKDGARLFVRLSACASASNVIEIAAEDLTRLRVLQDRLGQAHRMEAVGRLASEVALTCGKLLTDVHQNAQQWLVDAGRNAASRKQAEMLLDELTRAAGHLRQLVAYGENQNRTPALVDLNTVMRDLAPVLKHLAGDDVEVQLPDTSSPLNVDVETERIERVLVNLAAYGRERMPFGGRLTIEVGTIVVDRPFTAKYPNVRPGPHALITVTEIRRAARADGLLQLRDDPTAHSPQGRVAQKPRVDLATLQGLVGECGGHLWMRVQPLGDIVAKIRLPLLTSYDQTHPHAWTARGGRGRTITRWFQH